MRWNATRIGLVLVGVVGCTLGIGQVLEQNINSRYERIAEQILKDSMVIEGHSTTSICKARQDEFDSLVAVARRVNEKYRALARASAARVATGEVDTSTEFKLLENYFLETPTWRLRGMIRLYKQTTSHVEDALALNPSDSIVGVLLAQQQTCDYWGSHSVLRQLEE